MTKAITEISSKGSKQQLAKGSPRTLRRLRLGSGCIDIGTESEEAFFYHNKTLAFIMFSAKDANLFLHNHLKSPRF